METHLPGGRPYDFAELLDTFHTRVVTLSDLAYFATMGDNTPQVAKALADAVSNLRDDWAGCEKALNDWYDREHPEKHDTPPTAQPGKGGAQ